MYLLKKYKPVTPSLRQKITIKYSVSKFKNKLTKRIVKNGGRNNQGKITVRHRGGGVKRLYRIIDFKRLSPTSKIKDIFYDPYRSSLIAQGESLDGKLHNIILPEGVKVGDILQSSDTLTNPSVGDSTLLKNMPIGSLVHNIELKSKKGGQLIRSAGGFAQLINKTEKYAFIRLSSGEKRYVNLSCFATLGVVSNSMSNKQNLGKAGMSRWLGIRPKVRGVAMNPVDHPHGGGEGKTSGGRPSVTPKGRITKGQPTRKKKKFSNKIIVMSSREYRNSKKQSSRKGKYSF